MFLPWVAVLLFIWGCKKRNCYQKKKKIEMCQNTLPNKKREGKEERDRASYIIYASSIALQKYLKRRKERQKKNAIFPEEYLCWYAKQRFFFLPPPQTKIKPLLHPLILETLYCRLFAFSLSLIHLALQGGFRLFFMSFFYVFFASFLRHNPWEGRTLRPCPAGARGRNR